MKQLLMVAIVLLVASTVWGQTETPTETVTPTETETPTETPTATDTPTATETQTAVPRATDTPTANATQTHGMAVERTAAANATRTAAVPTAVVTPQPTGNPNENSHVTALETTLDGVATVRYAEKCLAYNYNPPQPEACRCVLYSKRVAAVDGLYLRCPDGIERAVGLFP